MALALADNRRTPSALEISQLHDKPAAQWERKIRELEEEKKYRVLEYLPIRKAIISELETPGSGKAVLVEELDGYNSGFSTDSMIKTMKDGFNLFMSKNRKVFTGIYSENVRNSNPYRIRLGGGEVKVTLHAEVEHSRYGRKRLFIYSSQYSRPEVNALQELLGMVAEQRDNGTAEDVLWLDLRAGTVSKLKSRSSVRANLVDTVNLYNKLF
ncbi:MAG: hypothetical protein WCK51_13470 [Armatimonadota bacterium]